MILLDMRGLLPRDEWGIRLAIIRIEGVGFAALSFILIPHKSIGFDAKGCSQALIGLEKSMEKVLE